MIKYTEKTSPLRIQLIKLRDSFKAKSKSSLIFRFVEVKLIQWKKFSFLVGLGLFGSSVTKWRLDSTRWNQFSFFGNTSATQWNLRKWTRNHLACRTRVRRTKRAFFRWETIGYLVINNRLSVIRISVYLVVWILHRMLGNETFLLVFEIGRFVFGIRIEIDMSFC